VINLPETLTADPRRFILTLTENGKIEHYENLGIQTIVSHKWKQYTRGFFQMQFYIFLCFLLAFIADIYYSLINKTTDEGDVVTKDERMLEATIAIKVTCLLFLLYFI
jgi:hypothetical protein